MDNITWKNDILSAVKSLSDKNYQEKNWFRGGDFHDSPEDMIAHLLLDLSFDEFLYIPSNYLSKNQIVRGGELIGALNEYLNVTNISYPRKLLNDPGWDHIIDLASKFYNDE